MHKLKPSHSCGFAARAMSRLVVTASELGKTRVKSVTILFFPLSLHPFSLSQQSLCLSFTRHASSACLPCLFLPYAYMPYPHSNMRRPHVLSSMLHPFLCRMLTTPQLLTMPLPYILHMLSSLTPCCTNMASTIYTADRLPCSVASLY